MHIAGKKYLACVIVCQFKCVMLNNAYSQGPSFLGSIATRNYIRRSRALRNYLFKVNKIRKRSPSLLTGDESTVSFCGVGGKTSNFCPSILELLFPKPGLKSTYKHASFA